MIDTSWLRLHAVYTSSTCNSFFRISNVLSVKVKTHTAFAIGIFLSQIQGSVAVGNTLLYPTWHFMRKRHFANRLKLLLKLSPLPYSFKSRISFHFFAKSNSSFFLNQNNEKLPSNVTKLFLLFCETNIQVHFKCTIISRCKQMTELKPCFQNWIRT